MDWVTQWMLPEMATTNISGPMNDWVGVTYDTDHPQARQLSTCSSVSPQSDTASSRFDIWNIGTIILIHLVYHMYTKFTLKYSCYLYSLAQWWMFHTDDICKSVPRSHCYPNLPTSCLPHLFQLSPDSEQYFLHHCCHAVWNVQSFIKREGKSLLSFSDEINMFKERIIYIFQLTI